jgi:thymidylate synthase
LVKVNDIREIFKSKYKYGNYVEDKSGCKTIEIVNASFVADESFIFGTPNQDYIQRELEWYESQSLSVHNIPGETPKIWQQVASTDGLINSNYGWCIYSEDNYDQYKNILITLRENPNSRQAVMIYTRPSMHEDATISGMSDFMCTNTVQYVLRDNKLITMVNMRSNDVVFGYNNDYAWQKYVRDKLIDDLNYPHIQYDPGPIYWNVGSLHIYERHFSYLKEMPFVMEESDK